MLTASRALIQSATASPELPRVPALRDLYDLGCRPRQGEVVMIAGRSGTQKSGFALWWTAQMNLPTLYLSADMTSFQASVRLAGMQTGLTSEQVEAEIAAGRGKPIFDALSSLRFTFSFGSPIRWRNVEAELDSYVELWNDFPKVIVIDNLMDIDGAESDYAAQMEAMQDANLISRATGATVIILHHASDKAWQATQDPWAPPSRDQVKGGLSEKPELSLSVALDPHTLAYRIAVIKQRMGPCDPTAQTYATLRAEPEKTRFHDMRTWRAEHPLHPAHR